MTDLSDFVDKDHDLGLKNFSSVSEVSDIAEPVDTDDFFTRNDDIYKLWVLDNFGDNLSTGLSESDSEKASNLDNEIFKGVRLGFLSLIFQ